MTEDVRCERQIRSRARVASITVALLCILASFAFSAARAFADSADPYSGIVTNAADNERTGWYSDEPNLTPAAVTAGDFGQLFSVALNGGIGAQPLLADGTLLVATQSNYVYGLDPNTGVIKWQDQVGTPWNPSDIGCTDVTSGIRSTPVIDASAGVAYFTAKSYVSGDSGPAQWQMWAVSMASGAVQPGFPVTIQGTAQNDPNLTFNATDQLQRPGLLLMDGVVYAAFGSNCDRGIYQGWVFGVTTAGQIQSSWTDCNGAAGSLCAGIWQSGGGLASDKDGNILLITGNNASPTPPLPGSPPPGDLGESVVRLVVQPNGTLEPVDFFAPYDATVLDGYDADFGSGGPLVLPSEYFGTSSIPDLMVAVGKQGYVYLLNRDDLGGIGEGAGGSDDVVQRVGPNGGVWSRPSAWPGDGGWVWINTGGSTTPGAYGYLQAYKYGVTGAGAPALTLYAQSQDGFGYGDGSPMITSNGTASGSGVVWMVWSADGTGADAQLRAYDATPSGTTPTLLWSAPIGSNTPRFAPAGIGDGIVYVGTRDGHLLAFGAPVNQPVQAPSVQFPPAIVGQTATATETITANSNLTVTAITPEGAGYALAGTTPTLPATLTAGQSLTANLTFTPSTVGPSAGSMAVDTSAGNTTVALSGQGVSPNPVLQSSTPVVSFGGTTPGNTVSQSVVLTNTGGVPLTFDASTLPSAPFTATGVPASGYVLQPSDSVTVNLAFSPTTEGSFSDSLVIDSNGGDINIGLTGQAYSPSKLVITPIDQTFPDTAPGSVSTATFTITDQGGSPLEITKSQPPASGVISPLSQLSESSVIGAGQSETESVQFAPTAAGTYSDTWIITADDGQGEQIVHFVGYSEPSLLSVGSLDPEFGSAGTISVPAGQQDYATAYGVSVDPGDNTLIAGSALSGHNSSGVQETQATVLELNPDGQPDSTFGTNGEAIENFGGGGYSIAYGAAPGPLGTVLTWGAAESANASIKLYLSRFTSEGAIDRTFGSNGTILATLGSPNIDGVAGAVDPSGNLDVAVGNGATTPGWTVSQYSSAGVLNTLYGTTTPGRTTLTVPGSPASAMPATLVPAADGSLYIVGDAAGKIDVVHVLASGRIDTGYGSGGWATVSASGDNLTAGGASLDSSGNLVIAGSEIPTAGGSSQMIVARLLPSGSRDTSFGGGLATVSVGTTSTATGVVVTPIRVIVSGTSTNASGKQQATVVALTDAGSLDTSFAGSGIVTTTIGGSGANSTAAGIALAPGGRVTIAGQTDVGTGGTTEELASARFDTQAPLTSIAITPTGPSVADGLTAQLTATGTYADGTTANITGNVTWGSSDSSVATVSSPGGLLSGASEGGANVTASLDGVSASVPVTVTAPVITRIVVDPQDGDVGVGDTQQYTATAVYSDGSRVDVTADAAWSTGSSATATITSSGGVLTGVAVGATTVSATYDGIVGSQGMSVSPALESITVTPGSPGVTQGSTQQFTATATFSDGSTEDLTDQATWTSTNTAVATVSSLAAQSSGDIAGGLASALSAGQTTITATVSGISGSATLSVTVPPPSVTSLSPTSGPLAGGTAVTINGTGFNNASGVSFGGVPASSFTVVSNTEITTTSPKDSGGIVPVEVTGPNGTSAATTASEYTYLALPVVSGVSPGSGPHTGGTTVTVTGSGFTGATQVLFGSTAASSLTVVSDSEVQAVSPAGTSGESFNVHVIAPGGRSAANGNDLFSYLALPVVSGVSPGSGPHTGGTVVTVTGSGFTGATQVLFGATAASSLTVLSDSQVQATAPPGTSGESFNVHVTAPGGKSATNSNDLFTYLALPVVSGVSPGSGPYTGGTVVTVTGSGFTGATQVLFGAVAAPSFTILSDSEVQVVSPAGPSGESFNVHVIAPGGKSATNANDLFAYTSAVNGASLLILPFL